MGWRMRKQRKKNILLKDAKNKGWEIERNQTGNQIFRIKKDKNKINWQKKTTELIENLK